MPICANCGAHQPDDAAFCDECGSPLRGAQTAVPVAPVSVQARTVVASSVCPACGAQTASQDPFCTNCGAALKEPSQPASVPTPPSMSAKDMADATEVAGAMAVAAISAVPAPPAADTMEAGVIPAVVSGEGVRTVVEEPVCGQCGAVLVPGSAFCDMCGTPVGARGVLPSEAASTQVAAQTPPAPEWGQYRDGRTVMVGAPAWEPPVAPAPPFQITGRLIVQATGAVLPLSPGKIELLIGREDPINGIFPDVDLTDHGGDGGGVSRKHARLTVRSGQFMIEDLNSVNGTFINGARLVFGQQIALSDGDQIRLGHVTLVFRVP